MDTRGGSRAGFGERMEWVKSARAARRESATRMRAARRETADGIPGEQPEPADGIGEERNQPGTRRRGDVLEGAILDAAWELLIERGFAELTFERVAFRAATSRSVIYRRWSTREALVEAAFARQFFGHQIDVPDTGSLRGDLLAVINASVVAHADLLLVALVQLSSYIRDNGTSLMDLMAQTIGDQVGTVTATILARAEQRGEISLAKVPKRVISLPWDLLRGQIVLTARAPTPEEVVAVLDELFFPLLKAYDALPGQQRPRA